jgi:hypothetical protein
MKITTALPFMIISQHRFPQPHYAINAIFGGLLLLLWQSSSFAEDSSTHRLQQCTNYAQTATEAQRENLNHQCGFTGSRWTATLAGHQAWCLQANHAQQQAEADARKQALAECFKDKLNPQHRDNQLQLPIACKDPHGLFVPQRWIASWYRYEKALYSPIENGVISYDFNQDRRNDYLFLERDKQNNVQITSCLSANNYPQAGGFERIPTDITFYASEQFPADTRYYLQLNNDLLTVEINFFAHNEGSCHTKASYRYIPLKQGFDVIDSTASCMPHTIAGSQEPYPLVPPAIPKMIR